MDKKYRLPIDFLTKWLEALRSGKYEQGNSLLYSNHKYCCLGVAGSIAGIPLFELEDSGYFTNLTVKDINRIPHELITHHYFGDYEIGERDLANACMTLNDVQRKSFIEIANWLEQNVEAY